MIGVVLVTHGPLAETLLAAAARIAGPLPRARAVSVGTGEGPESVAERIAWEAEQVDDGSGVLFLVDLYGSTPCTACVAEVQRRGGDVLSGVSLPMLLKLETCAREGTSATDLGRALRDSAVRAVRLHGDPGGSRA